MPFPAYNRFDDILSILRNKQNQLELNSILKKLTPFKNTKSVFVLYNNSFFVLSVKFSTTYKLSTIDFCILGNF